MGFWDAVGRGLKAASEHVAEEQRRYNELHDRYSNYDDRKLANIYRGTDNSFFPHDARERKMAARVLIERGYGRKD